jgi:hypothetical protein
MREQDHFKGWRADSGAFSDRWLDIKAGIAKLLQDSFEKW